MRRYIWSCKKNGEENRASGMEFAHKVRVSVTVGNPVIALPEPLLWSFSSSEGETDETVKELAGNTVYCQLTCCCRLFRPATRRSAWREPWRLSQSAK
jgi:hypothetical protein